MVAFAWVRIQFVIYRFRYDCRRCRLSGTMFGSLAVFLEGVVGVQPRVLLPAHLASVLPPPPPRIAISS